MDCFNILEIEKTTDRKKIKKAYSRLLKKYHPEEYPDEYMMIHQAYQQAMNYAKNGTEKLNFYYDTPINFNGSFYHQKMQQESLDDTRQKQFQDVEEYEKVYLKKMGEITVLMEQLKSYRRRLKIPSLSFFKSQLFMKYYKDSDFMDCYINAIVHGLYRDTNEIERRKLKQIHNALYFSNQHDKNENELLYHVLYPYLYNRKGNGIEFVLIIICFISNLFLIPITLEPYELEPLNVFIAVTCIFIFVEIALLYLYFIHIVSHYQGNQRKETKLYKFLYYFIISFFIGMTCLLICLNVINSM